MIKREQARKTYGSTSRFVRTMGPMRRRQILRRLCRELRQKRTREFITSSIALQTRDLSRDTQEMVANRSPVRGSEWFQNVLLQYQHDNWKALMRMSRPVFDSLLSKIKDKLVDHHTSGGRPTKAPPVLQVALFVYYCAHGAPSKSLEKWFGVEKSTACRYMLHVADAINSLHASAIRWPKTTAELATITAQFESDWPGTQDSVHIIGCIDACHLPVRCPRRARCKWINRRGVATIRVLAAADARGRFTLWEGYLSGEGPDIDMVTKQSKARFLMSTRRSDNIVLLGDGGFDEVAWCLVPYDCVLSGPLTPQQKLFNDTLWKSRQIIDDAFAHLKAQWSILRRPDSLPGRTAKFATACAIMYNLRIEADDTDDIRIQEDLDKIKQHGVRPEVAELQRMRAHPDWEFLNDPDLWPDPEPMPPARLQNVGLRDLLADQLFRAQSRDEKSTAATASAATTLTDAGVFYVEPANSHMDQDASND